MEHQSLAFDVPCFHFPQRSKRLETHDESMPWPMVCVCCHQATDEQIRSMRARRAATARRPRTAAPPTQPRPNSAREAAGAKRPQSALVRSVTERGEGFPSYARMKARS